MVKVLLGILKKEIIELEKQMIHMNAQEGCVIVMDVKTGFVRAIANLSKKEKGGYAESYNFAIGNAEVPGSTYKLASVMAGLEDNKFKITDKVNANGSYFIAGAKLSDSNHGMGYGNITIKKAFATNVAKAFLLDVAP